MDVPELLGAGCEPVGQRRNSSVAGQVGMQGSDRNKALVDGNVGDVLVGGAVHGRAGIIGRGL